MSESGVQEPTLQQAFGRYRALARLGAGAMAQVYRGYDPELDRQVAIKVLRGTAPAGDDLRQRFRREARAIAALHHPHIVQVYDFGLADDAHYLVMEYVCGQSLAERLAVLEHAGKRLPREQALAILAQLADALDYAHAQGVIHRDVKPGNVLLRDGPAVEAVLADFGLVLLQNRAGEMTRGESFGTPEYIAPEQAVRSSAAVAQSDIYSLGVVAYRLLTGALPFSAGSAVDLALQHVSAPPRPPRAVDPAIPLPVEAAVLRVLAKDPAARFATAGEFVAALQAGFAVKAPPAEATVSAALAEAVAPPGLYPPMAPLVWPEATAAPRLPPPLPAAPVPARRRSATGVWLGAALLVPCVLFTVLLATGALLGRPLFGFIAGSTPQFTRLPDTAAPKARTPTARAPARVSASPSPKPSASSTATARVAPADARALIAALQEKIKRAQTSHAIKPDQAKSLRGKLDEVLRSMNEEDQDEEEKSPLGRLANFQEYLDEQARDGKIPAALAAEWQADAAAIEAALRAQPGGR